MSAGLNKNKKQSSNKIDDCFTLPFSVVSITKLSVLKNITAINKNKILSNILPIGYILYVPKTNNKHTFHIL